MDLQTILQFEEGTEERAIAEAIAGTFGLEVNYYPDLGEYRLERV
jgi:hypothetical protein